MRMMGILFLSLVSFLALQSLLAETEVTVPPPFHPHSPVEALLLVTDPGEDPGDEKTFLLLNTYLKRGIVKKLVGVVACHYPSYERTRLARGLLDQLGLHWVPVGQGSNHPVDKYINPMLKHQFEASYMADKSRMLSSVVRGEELIKEAIEKAKPKELTILVISQLTDVAEVLEPEKFAKKVRSMVIMTEVVMDPTGKPQLDEQGYMQAEEKAHNNHFDMKAANLVIRMCQEKGIQLVIVTRQVSMAAKISRGITKKMAESGNPVGKRLLALEIAVMQYLWQRVHLPADDEVGRLDLPGRCDVKWFLDMFCLEAKWEEIQEIGPKGQIWKYVEYDTLQDPSALVATIPDLRKHHFTPVVHKIGDVEHYVIGASKSNHGVNHAEELRTHMETGIFEGQQPYRWYYRLGRLWNDGVHYIQGFRTPPPT